MLGVAKKSPADVLDYDIQFEEWLSDGDAIMTATAVASDAALVVGTVEVIGTSIVRVWLSGGVLGSSYTVDVTATTAQGRTKQVTFNIRVSEC